MLADPLTIRTIALPPFIDLGATVLFSITGATVAIRRHYDVIGVFVLALACGLGGGLLRDGLFIQNGAASAVRDELDMLDEQDVEVMESVHVHTDSGMDVSGEVSAGVLSMSSS